MMERIETYITYKWGGTSETFVDEIAPLLNAVSYIRVCRDKEILGYRQSIEGFMEELRHGDIVVMVLSDQYLHSINCMYEMSGLFGTNAYKEKVFPVMVSASIRDREQYLEICKYWQDKQSELNKLILDFHNAPTIASPFKKDLLKIEDVLCSIPNLFEYCRDANVPDIDTMRRNGYSVLVNSISERAKQLLSSTQRKEAPMLIRVLIEINTLSSRLLEKLAHRYKTDFSQVETANFGGQPQSENPVFAIEDTPMAVYLLLQELQNEIDKEDVKSIHYTSSKHKTERDLRTISETLKIIRYE